MTLHWKPDDPAHASTSVEVEVPVFSDDPGSLVGLALAGCGLVLAPDYSVRHVLGGGQLIDLLPHWQLPIPEGDTILALTLPWPLAPESARAFVRFVTRRLR